MNAYTKTKTNPQQHQMYAFLPNSAVWAQGFPKRKHTGAHILYFKWRFYVSLFL